MMDDVGVGVGRCVLDDGGEAGGGVIDGVG